MIDWQSNSVSVNHFFSDLLFLTLERYFNLSERFFQLAFSLFARLDHILYLGLIYKDMLHKFTLSGCRWKYKKWKTGILMCFKSHWTYSEKTRQINLFLLLRCFRFLLHIFDSRAILSMVITNISYCFPSHDYPCLYFGQIKKSVQFSDWFSYQQVVILITLIGDWIFISFASSNK